MVTVELTNNEKIRFALIDLKHIEQNRELLKGHFSLVAKRHGIKVSELKKAYNELINRREQ